MKTSETLPLPGFEMTESQSMQSVGASRAKTLARQERAQELKASGQDYGLSTPALLANYDHKSSSWRTSQRCLVEGWTRFSETWPRSGMMRNGIAYQLPPLVRLTGATGSGLWPTPTTFYTRENWPIEKVIEKQQEVKAATLAKGKHHTGNGFGMHLAHAVKMWPTPCASDNRDRGGPSTPAVQRRKSIGKSIELSMTVDGKLNPKWVEWLMGFPLEWTAID